MKILKIFGVVVGIHVFALILIFANPGCSSSTKSQPSPTDTLATNAEPSPSAVIIPPTTETSPLTAAGEPVGAGGFDPNAAAGDASIRFTPTRPGTPAASTLEAQPVNDVTPATTYTATKGDSLWSIAKRHNTTVSELASANNLKAGTTVRLGQKLIIPTKPLPAETTRVPDAPAAASAAPSASRSGGNGPVLHIVKAGETLSAIEKKYQLKRGELAVTNNISNPALIRPGMELVIPGWRAPANKTPASAPTPVAPTPAPVSAPETVPTIMIPSPIEAVPMGPSPALAEPPIIQVEEPGPSGR